MKKIIALMLLVITIFCMEQTAFAAQITPSVSSVVLSSGQTNFTFDLMLNETVAFAGAEFYISTSNTNLKLANVEFKDVKDYSTRPLFAKGNIYSFGFYSSEDKISGNLKVATLTFEYSGADAQTITLSESKILRYNKQSVTTADTSTPSFTVSVSRETVGVGSSSSSSSSYSNNVKDNTNIVNVDITKNADGVATAKATDNQISNAIDAVKKIGGNNPIELKTSATDRVNEIIISLSKTAISQISNNNISSLKINSDEITTTLDSVAINTINKTETSGEVTFSAKKVDKNTLSEEARKRVGDRPIYDISIKVGDANISDLGGGKAVVSIAYTPVQGEDKNAIVIYYISSSGELQIVPNCIYDEINARVIFTVNHLSQYGISYNKVSFSDVTGWATDYITYLSARNIINGMGDNKFVPDNKITRAEFVKILYGISSGTKQSLEKYNSTMFVDVNAEDWFAPYVLWAEEQHIVSGFEDKSFKPTQSITREQITVIIDRFAKNNGYVLPIITQEKIFADNGTISSWATSAVKVVQMAGIVNGKDDNKFAPQENATRAEATKMLAMLMKVNIISQNK